MRAMLPERKYRPITEPAAPPPHGSRRSGSAAIGGTVRHGKNVIKEKVVASAWQINAAVEDTDVYKSIVAALQDEELKVKVAQHSCELTEKMNRQLRNANAELQEKYDAAVTSYNAPRSDFDALSIESKAKGKETLKNARGAGRKAALSKEVQEEVQDMHRLGMSYRDIAQKIGVSFSVVARACQASKR